MPRINRSDRDGRRMSVVKPRVLHVDHHAIGVVEHEDVVRHRGIEIENDPGVIGRRPDADVRHLYRGDRGAPQEQRGEDRGDPDQFLESS